jgi:hypothetical protein
MLQTRVRRKELYHKQAEMSFAGFSSRIDYLDTSCLLGALSRAAKSCRNVQKDVDLLGIEPRTFPMLRENYTTKPQARHYHSQSDVVL